MKSLRVLAVAVAVAVLVPSAASRAGTVGGGVPTFALDVTSSVGGDSLHLTPTPTPHGGTLYLVTASESTPSFSIVFDAQLNADPSIMGSFTLTNLSGTTQTFSVSATLGGVSVGGPTTIQGYFGIPEAT